MRKIFLFLKNLYSNRIVKFIFIPIILFMFWILASILLVYPPSFSVTSQFHNKSDFKNFSTKKILKGDRVMGSFMSSKDNLGIVVIRLNAPKVISYENEDTLIFRIREVGSKDWIIKNSYKSGLMSKIPFFPFGFPPIKNSKGKEYEFQLVSLNGNEKNAVSLSSVNPIMASQYKFSKDKIFSSTNSFINFIAIKVQNFLTDKQSIILSFPYLLPLLFYLFAVFPNRSSYISFLTLYHLVLVSILINALINYYATSSVGDIILIFFWLICIIKYKLDSSISFLLSALFLLIALFGIISNQILLEQKSSDWAYYLLAIGIVQILFEIRGVNKNIYKIFKQSLRK